MGRARSNPHNRGLYSGKIKPVSEWGFQYLRDKPSPDDRKQWESPEPETRPNSPDTPNKRARLSETGTSATVGQQNEVTVSGTGEDQNLEGAESGDSLNAQLDNDEDNDFFGRNQGNDQPANEGILSDFQDEIDDMNAQRRRVAGAGGIDGGHSENSTPSLRDDASLMGRSNQDLLGPWQYRDVSMA